MATPDKKNADLKATPGKHDQPQAQEQHAAERVAAEKAHEQAEHDMEDDPDISIHSPNDDLDEGETSLLGEDKIPVL